MEQKNLKIIKENLDSFSGSNEFFRYYLIPNYIYTEGIKYLAEECSAYWLLDLIFSTIKFNILNEEFIVINLKVDLQNNKAIIVFDDGNNNLLYEQEIKYTDFPLDKIKLYFCNDTLMLPGEY